MSAMQGKGIRMKRLYAYSDGDGFIWYHAMKAKVLFNKRTGEYFKREEKLDIVPFWETVKTYIRKWL